MALRNIVEKGERCLEKRCRSVVNFDERLHTLLDDMGDTLIQSGGVGLAAPQVGILRRAVLVLETNVPEGEHEYVIELINPEIIERSGEQTGPEGCLSVPGVFGLVSRPDYVKVRAQDRFGEFFEVEGTGLTARCFCHELDHLEGRLFVDIAEKILSNEELNSFYAGEEGEEE